MKHLLSTLVLLIVLAGCGTKNSISPEKYKEFSVKGNEIASQAQASLLKNVAAAMQQGGSEYAVEFCNLKAGGIVDSLNAVFNCSISRVSDKNRNPENALTSENDGAIWKAFHQGTQTDTLLAEGEKLVYYKRINTAMPACMKCHGEPGTDIEPATAEKIKKLYPEDKATGYSLNDFRGLWKVSF